MAKRSKSVPPLPVLPAGLELVDSHCHLDMDEFQGDREAVIARARQAGVGWLITIGIDLASSKRAVALARQQAGLVAAIGVHPQAVAPLAAADYQALAELAAAPEVKAYGEIGLDYVRLYSPKDLQEEHFRRQLRLAKELGLPVIIHDRGAHAELLAILRQEAPLPAGGVMHCFSGNLELARQAMALGLHISIPGVVTFNKARPLQEVACHIPLSRLLLETDAPYLAPVPRRGRRNEPAYLLYTAQKVAELRQIPLAELARTSTENAVRLFNLGPGPADRWAVT